MRDHDRVDLQQELAVFLRTRREHLDPIEIGLPARQRRRTPGLRREEVAELAGISVDYLIRLEQGRGARPSRDVLDALARALQLDDAGHAHLFDLAGHGVARRPAVAERPPTGLARLIEQLSPLPAILLDRRFDILAWNPEMIG